MKQLSLTEVLEPPVNDRLRLVELIWNSIAAFPDSLPLSDQLRAELDRRLTHLDEYPDAAYDWEDVKARIRSDE